MKKTGISLISLLFPLLALASAGQGKVMQQAAALYGQGEKDRAILLWEGLRASGYTSPALCYNLGNAYLEAGQLGKAVLNYERAMLLQPGKDHIRSNLRLAMKKVEGDPLPWPEAGLALRWRAVRGLLPSNAWAFAGLVLCWAGLAAGWWGRRKQSWTWRMMAALGFLPALLAWSLAFSSSRALVSDYCVVVEQRLPVRVGPDEQSREAAVAYEGWKVKRLDKIGAWVKIELADGQEGWAPEKGMERL